MEVRHRIMNKEYESLQGFVFSNTVQAGGVMPHSLAVNVKTNNPTKKSSQGWANEIPNILPVLTKQNKTVHTTK